MKKSAILFAVCLLGVAAGFLLVFSAATSPLYPNVYGADSAFYRFIGSMVLRGKTLYRDIWDNKGPVLFFIQALGALRGTHNAPLSLIFPMQTISLFLSLLILCRTDGSGKSPFRLLLLSVPAFAFLACVLESGNLSEEWCLPMISLSLFLLLRYTDRAEELPGHPLPYAFLHGVCLAVIAFIRINNAVSLCAGLAVIAISLIRRKQWRNLFANLLWGLLGAAAVTAPLCLYFLARGALGVMLYAIFTYNLKYAARVSHSAPEIRELLVRFLPMAAALLLLLLRRIRSGRFTLSDILLLTVTLLNAVMLWRSNIFRHYYIIFFPVFLLILIRYGEYRDLPALLTVLAVCAFFTWQDLAALPGLAAARNEPEHFTYAAALPEEEKDPVMALFVSPEIYLNSGLIPASRFAAYHLAHFPTDPALQTVFLADLQEDPPLWIMILSGAEGVLPEIEALLAEQYELVHEEEGVSYYRRGPASGS